MKISKFNWQFCFYEIKPYTHAIQVNQTTSDLQNFCKKDIFDKKYEQNCLIHYNFFIKKWKIPEEDEEPFENPDDS